MTKRMWHKETGVSQDFGPDETPGPEFIDHHPHDTAKNSDPPASPPAPAKEPADDPPDADPDPDKPMTKAEIIEALKSGEIDHNPKDKRDDLDLILIKNLKLVLSGADIAFDEDESSRSLYGKLQAHIAGAGPAQE